MSILMPKKVKHRKWRKGRSHGLSDKGNELAFGSFGLKCIDTKWISGRQLEAARRAILRNLKKGGKLWVRIFPEKPVTKKGAETPMGGGKGGVDHYVFPIRPGRIIFELDGVKEDVAKESFRTATNKLPVRTKFVSK